MGFWDDINPFNIFTSKGKDAITKPAKTFVKGGGKLVDAIIYPKDPLKGGVKLGADPFFNKTTVSTFGNIDPYGKTNPAFGDKQGNKRPLEDEADKPKAPPKPSKPKPPKPDCPNGRRRLMDGSCETAEVSGDGSTTVSNPAEEAAAKKKEEEKRRKTELLKEIKKYEPNQKKYTMRNKISKLEEAINNYKFVLNNYRKNIEKMDRNYRAHSKEAWSVDIDGYIINYELEFSKRKQTKMNYSRNNAEKLNNVYEIKQWKNLNDGIKQLGIEITDFKRKQQQKNSLSKAIVEKVARYKAKNLKNLPESLKRYTKSGYAFSKESTAYLQKLFDEWSKYIDTETDRLKKKYPVTTVDYPEYFKGPNFSKLFSDASTTQGARALFGKLSDELKINRDSFIKKMKNDILAAVTYKELKTKFLVKKNGVYKTPDDLSEYTPQFMKLVKTARKLTDANRPITNLVLPKNKQDNSKYKNKFSKIKDTNTIIKSKEKLAIEKAQLKRRELIREIFDTYDPKKEKNGDYWRQFKFSPTTLLGLSGLFNVPKSSNMTSKTADDREYLLNALAMDEAYKLPNKRLPILLGRYDYLPQYSNEKVAIYGRKSSVNNKYIFIKVAYKGTNPTGGFVDAVKEVGLQDILGILLDGYRFLDKLDLVKPKEIMNENAQKKKKQTKKFSSKYSLEISKRVEEFFNVYKDFPQASYSFTGHSLGARMAFLVSNMAHNTLKNAGLRKKDKPFFVAGFSIGSGVGSLISNLRSANTKFVSEDLTPQQREKLRLQGKGYTKKSIPFKFYRVAGDPLSYAQDKAEDIEHIDIIKTYCGGDTSSKINHSPQNFYPIIFWAESDKKLKCEAFI